ncbi:MAG TPA: hypothetical protein V6C85_06850 [Allocoleopsis sp.]
MSFPAKECLCEGLTQKRSLLALHDRLLSNHESQSATSLPHPVVSSINKAIALARMTPSDRLSMKLPKLRRYVFAISWL